MPVPLNREITAIMNQRTGMILADCHHAFELYADILRHFYRNVPNMTCVLPNRAHVLQKANGMVQVPIQLLIETLFDPNGLRLLRLFIEGKSD